MIDALREHLRNSGILLVPAPKQGEGGAGRKIIVACSGGPDSMALAHLLHKLGYSLVIAHVNHRLRGTDADADEACARTFAETHAIPFRSFQADPEQLKSAPEGMQSAARSVRYNFLERCRADEGATFIATAHHRDDMVEGYLWHLMRGSHWRGFSGIPAINGHVVRPLLPFTHEQLLAWLDAQSIAYRHDKSNDSGEYSRNRIRHELIPLMESIRPGFRKNIVRQVEMFTEINAVLKRFLGQLAHDIVFLRPEGLYIAVDGLSELPFKRLLFIEALADYGFHANRVDEALHLLDAEVGKTLYSRTHRIMRGRDHLLIAPLAQDEGVEVLIEEGTEELAHPLEMTLEYGERDDFALPRDPYSALMDLRKLSFPLELRRWSHGDRIRPLGLKGSVKLSDLFVQAKLEQYQKEEVYVLVSNGEIVWVPGFRMADGVKVTARTGEVVLLRVSREGEGVQD